MTTEPIRILMASDLHFGIPGINQEEMAQAFADTVFPLLPETDIFFINGDFFDTLVIFDSHGFDPIYDTIMNLFTLCDQHKVTLRILQGTWMHDRNQLKRFKALYRNGRFGFNFRLAEGIELEELTIRDRSIKVVYVPDDLPFTSSGDIVDVIERKMVDIGWDSLDYGCMHGFFEFTIPLAAGHDNRVVFREDQFPFIRKMIDVGHVHQHRVKGKVISNGSFDRMVYGDEEPKGFIKIFDYPDHYTAHFVENKHAAVFDTLVIDKDDTTETIRDKVVSHLSKIHSDRKISLRFLIESTEHRDAIKDWMKKEYPEINIKFKKKGDPEDQSILVPSSILVTPAVKRVAPTPKTLSSFIRAHMPESYVLTIEEIDRYLEPVSDKT